MLQGQSQPAEPVLPMYGEVIEPKLGHLTIPSPLDHVSGSPLVQAVLGLFTREKIGSIQVNHPAGKNSPSCRIQRDPPSCCLGLAKRIVEIASCQVHVSTRYRGRVPDGNAQPLCSVRDPNRTIGPNAAHASLLPRHSEKFQLDCRPDVSYLADALSSIEEFEFSPWHLPSRESGFAIDRRRLVGACGFAVNRRCDFEMAPGVCRVGRYNRVFDFVRPVALGVEAIWFDGVVGGSQTHRVNNSF